MNDFRELEEPRPLTEAEQQAIDDLKLMFEQNVKINFQTDNYFLTKYLRYRDWNVQDAYESIRNYYKIKVNWKEADWRKINPFAKEISRTKNRVY